jgi:hypothetical protein
VKLQAWTSLILVWLALTTGCVSSSEQARPTPGPGVSTGPIDEVNLLATPTALNFDHLAGPDGFLVKVYLGNRNKPKPIRMENGSLELLMFDGGLAQEAGQALQAKRVWRFTAQDLKAFEIHTSIGVGYQLAPILGGAKPSGNKIAVVVRYLSPRGATISSAPSVISVALQ